MKATRIRHGAIAALLVLALVASVFALVPAVSADASPAVKVQMVVCLDGSSSMEPGPGQSTTVDWWEVITKGLGQAVDNASVVPHDGSVELGVVVFGWNPSKVQRVIPMTVITASNAGTIAAQIKALVWPTGWTPTGSAIAEATAMMKGSDNWTVATRHIINISTDGAPAGPGLTGVADAKAAAIAARNAAIGDGVTGVTEIHAEVVGATSASDPGLVFMRDSIVYPPKTGGGTIAPPYDPVFKGFVVMVDGGNTEARVSEYVAAIQGKLGSADLNLVPLEATNTVRTKHTVTATLTDSLGNAIPGATIDFAVISGPNTDEHGSGVTDKDGKASWTYEDTKANAGDIDTIQASRGELTSNTVSKTWKEGSPPVPGISGWGIMAMVAALGALGVFMLLRRQSRVNG